MKGYNITELAILAGGGTTATMRKRLDNAKIEPLHVYKVNSRTYAIYGEDAAALAVQCAEVKKARQSKKLQAAAKTISTTTGTVSASVLERLGVIEQQLQALHALTSKLATAFDVPDFPAFPEIEGGR